MFRRTPSPAPADDAALDKPGGKGRPTPSRKEAEAAARERARLPRDRKAMARRERQKRADANRQVREAFKSGDERHLPARDQGPVRRFIRDFVDARIGFAELLAPLLLISLLVSSFNPVLATTFQMTMILLVLLDVMLLRFRVRRAVRQRFPDDSLKGVTIYALVRALNLRFFRLPKPRVKIGQPLPEHYR